ncbi:MAG: 1-acyl-sn-glycerol-3-phosphate acyltransferase, partial [Pyrinomonadaceae bacterium]
FEAARQLLKKGGSIALFPEGISHNSPKLLPIKTGAARIALGAASAGSDRLDVTIVPVGLFYTGKTTFRSEALLHFGEPFPVLSLNLDPDGEPPYDAVENLTDKIERALRDVTLNAESDAELHTARIAEEIIQASAETENLGETLDFLKTFVAEVDPEKSANDEKLETRLHEYDRKLALRGIEPVHLSLSQFSRVFVFRQAFIQTWRLILLAPFAFVGAVLHAPAYELCRLFAFYFTHHGADDIVSTVKVLAAMLFMPLTWLTTAVIVYFYSDWKWALVSIPVSVLLGYAALYTLEEWEELHGWARALWLYLTKREEFLKLFVERRKLQRELRTATRS